MTSATTTTAAAAAMLPPPAAPAVSPAARPRPAAPEPMELVAPPWRVTGDVYCVSFWSSAPPDRRLPGHAYSPLEAGAEFAGPAAGRPAGGLGMIQIIRYRDSPVGPYDEMLVVPGSFDWARRGPGGRAEKGRNPRISRIYVSQRQSCYNGRINWGCPKHLARFDWDAGPGDSVRVKVYPHDTAGDAAEARPSAAPFFQASFAPVPYAPSFPFATRWLGYLGFNTTVVMPPLPPGAAGQAELPGTDRWVSFVPQQYSRNTRVGWFDMAQQPPSGAAGHRNFWPGLGRWQLGVKMENAQVVFDHPLETWSTAVQPKSNL